MVASKEEEDLNNDSTFATELEIALDRNASEIFSKFHREIWHLVRSLPEVLHHADRIVDLLLLYMLSPAETPGEKSTSAVTAIATTATPDSKQRKRFVANQATTDILHLIAVLARDLRHEIHPYLHTKLLPRLMYDLLNPPVQPDKQPVPLDVTLVEAVFRTMSYIFRYDADALLGEVDGSEKDGKACLEGLRRYYGVTLAHKRDLIRRLAAETYAPVIRKLKSDNAKKRHLRRILRALAASSTSAAANNSRLQSDAVDGIAQLLFEVARGASGRLHSKGTIVINTILDCIESDGKNGQELVYAVASDFFQRLGHHLHGPHMVMVIVSVIHRAINKTTITSETSLQYFLQLVQQTSTNRKGVLIRQQKKLLDEVESLLKILLKESRFLALSVSCREAVTGLLFAILKNLPENCDLFARMTDSLCHVLTIPVGDISSTTTRRNVACVVVQDLLPFLPLELAMNTIGSAVLSAAAGICTTDPFSALTMVHAVASVRSMNSDDSDDIFCIDHAAACSLSDNETEALLKVCLVNVEAAMTAKECHAKLAACSKAASYLAAVGGDTDNNKRSEASFKRVSNWLIGLMQRIKKDDIESAQGINAGLVLSMAIESLARLSSLTVGYVKDASSVVAALKKASPIVVKHLLANPGHLWTLKSSSSFVAALRSVDLVLSNESSLVFESLIPNLSDQNHFRRLHALQILASYPKLPFVVNHADLDLTGDLDEEDNTPDVNKGSDHNGVGLTGLCSIIETLLSIESTVPDLKMERNLLSRISRIGVLGRTGKLPVIYAEAAAAHLLGALYIKFAPIWNVAVKAVVGLAKCHDECVWPALHKQIALLMQNYPNHRQFSDNDQKMGSFVLPVDPTGFYTLCAAWESSQGQDPSLFRHDIEYAEEHGRVSRHHSTDEASVFESLWSVVEGATHLLTAHSRTVVPMFLCFMHRQYYAVHADDPDARELRLADILSGINAAVLPSSDHSLSLDGRLVQRRLKCMLKAFASVNGPQQLFKHNVLLSIFLSLLGNQDTQTSQLALSCILKFKLAYLLPYSDILKSFYDKGKLRDAMMQLNSGDETGIVLPEHRANFIPVLSRVLFGRLSARATGAKSSKDSPAARRSAVLSFLSAFCESDDELFPFLYLMMRVYVPARVTLQTVESQELARKRFVLESIASLSPKDCSMLPLRVHQGFLNVLEAVISQLGRQVAPFIPTMMSVIVALCKAFEVKGVDATNRELHGTDFDEESDTQGHSDRGGSIRSLCYRRLADIFSQFSDTYDFTPHSGCLWSSLRQSLLLLPVMVVNSDKVPSLLLLLRTISGEKTLVKMLNDDDNVVPAVLKCLSDSCRPAIVEATLTFIDNLLNDDDESPACGRELLKLHIGLMLDQFRLRLGCALIHRARGTNFTPKSTLAASSTWRRELTILCKVSNLMDDRHDGFSDIQADAMGSLCSLLIPFLDHQRGIPDAEKQKVLDILEKVISKVPAESAIAHYATLSALLGPFKARAGFTSRGLRQSLARFLNSIADTSYPVASPTTEILLCLCAVNAKRVDEMDYDSVIPTISDLGNATGISSWSCLGGVDSGRDASVLLPIVQTCFHLLFDEDGVVSRGSYKALQTLVTVASTQMAQEIEDEHRGQTWRKLLEGCLVPLIRSGLSSRSESARRFFLLLLKEVAQCNKSSPSPNLYGDLSCLIREDEPDLDFFQNITHVQIHRRARALQRLRKLLIVDSENLTPVPLSLQSLSNVLLPLATHPIYESKTKLDESFALEGIATVGAIARHLSWSKYSAVLWTHLTQFERHAEQEKYLIGLICAIIDGFHFDVVSLTTDDGGDHEESTNSVWRALENRIIPKVEDLLLKDKVEKKGGILRPSVVLALHKLIHKLPMNLFEAKLPRLLAVICDALRNRDSNARDVARTSLAKMVVEMDMAYLADVTRELASSLTEGYKLHVRNATLHTILLEISKVYIPPMNFDGKRGSQPIFDETVPALMDLIQQDIFGVTQERRDAQGSQMRFVKEAGGSKSAHSLELIASMIRFSPSSPCGATKQLAPSSIHVMVSPLLERLRTPGVPTSVARRIKECFSRIVTGLLRNPSLKPNEVILFVLATLEPFVGSHEMESIMEIMCDGLSSDDDDAIKPIHVSGKRSLSGDGAISKVRGQVVEWRPSTLKSASSTKSARNAKSKDEMETVRVQDGASAPKLTGSRRNASSYTHVRTTVNDPAAISAVVFGLQLLCPMLKNEAGHINADAILDPFVPLLTTCVCRCRDTEVVLLSLKCLGWLLKTDLPSLARFAKSLAKKTLELLTSAGSNEELLQATFKMLTLLIVLDRKGRLSDIASINKSENAMADSTTLPLDAEQLKVLISFLRESIVTSDQHNPAIALIKAIMSRRYVSADFYDMMETMLDQSVRSPKASLRDQSGIVFVNYLLNYPLSSERIEQHLKQVVLNLSYEYAEGRLSAIGLTINILDKLPMQVIEQYCQLFFLPLALQLVNDESKECREAVAKCLGRLLRKLSMEVLQLLYGYTERWCQGDVPLCRMALQLFAIFVDVRPDLIKRNEIAKKLLETIQLILNENPKQWEIIYFALNLIEKMTKSFNQLVGVCAPLWKVVIHSMANSHTWIKMSSVRLLTGHLQLLDPENFEATKTFLKYSPGALFQIARNFCFQLGAEEQEQNDDLTPLVVKGLTWAIQAMAKYPELCFEAGDNARDRDPVQWVMTRLSNIARVKGVKRRQAVFKCFAAFATFSSKIAFDHLELMLEPLHRVELETRNELELPSLASKIWPINDAVSEEAQLAKDVLHLLEERCVPHEVFLKAYAKVKIRARDKKEQRKADAKAETVVNPKNAAKHRIEKQEREKKRRKRRVDDRRLERGATAKRQHFSL